MADVVADHTDPAGPHVGDGPADDGLVVEGAGGGVGAG